MLTISAPEYPDSLNARGVTTPLVDVNVVTYNHEKYVAAAIESVLTQRTNFAYRLIVGDDCSTDNTQAIVRQYAKKYPDRIELVFDSRHRGLGNKDRVGIKLLGLSTAKYVALLDGDDYWTDASKLQKQVDFLESHPECSVCFHNARMVFEDPSEPPQYYCAPDQKEVSTLVDIVLRCFLIPCTVMFRNDLFGKLPDAFARIRNADWVLFVLLAEHGNLSYLNEVMADYRVHREGAWQGLARADQLREHVTAYRVIDKYLKYRYAEMIGEKVASLQEEIDRISALEKQLAKQRARTCLDDYHRLARAGEMSNALTALLGAMRSDLASVIHPHRAAAVVKNGLLGALSFGRNRNTFKGGSSKQP